MSKQSRRIAARGLTASSSGAVIEYADAQHVLHKIKVLNVGYNPSAGKTVVEYTATVELPNNLEITVWDK